MRFILLGVFVLVAACGIVRKNESSDVGIRAKATCQGCDKCEVYIHGEGVETDEGSEIVIDKEALDKANY